MRSVQAWYTAPQELYRDLLDGKPQTPCSFALRSCRIGVTMSQIDLEDSQEIE
jgi:hypothetical protein